MASVVSWLGRLAFVVVALACRSSPRQESAARPAALAPAVVAPAIVAQAAEPLLAPGPFAVGFRSSWAFDEGRTYRTVFDEGKTYGAEKSPRPVLVLLWYPARDPGGEPMPHGRYFSIASDDARLTRFADALSAYARGVFAEQVVGKPEADLDADGRAELAAALAAPTLCRLDAAPAGGPFPLVVYHCGAGSSFEDNAALCAYLASHGYVVLGSAFPRADGSALNIDAQRGSAEDVQFLVRWAHALAFADCRHVGLVGHSAGAQAMLMFASQPGCVGDALVLLDTTQDYYALGMPLHESVVREATEGIAVLTRPMLVAAGPEAMFALCDTLVNAERTYLTVPELGHDEYISQGHQRLDRIARQAAAKPAAADKAELARTPLVRTNYRALCETVREFLDAELRGSPEFASCVERARAQPWDPTVPCLVRVPRGVSDPEPYDVESDAPPTPRQFRRLLARDGVEDACLVLERFRDAKPQSPLFSSTMFAGSMLYRMLEDGRRDDAARYYAALKAIPLPVMSLFEFLADISGMQKKPERALHLMQVAHDLDPEDAAVAAKLHTLEEQQPK